jgi:sulfur carrier protein ThiS
MNYDRIVWQEDMSGKINTMDIGYRSKVEAQNAYCIENFIADLVAEYPTEEPEIIIERNRKVILREASKYGNYTLERTRRHRKRV